jgi:mitochondrial fission protein ELM1
MRSLADALGWPYECKQLAYTPLEYIPNLFLGASRLTLDRRSSSPLLPPWPDLVIGASRRSVPVALWIRKQSQNRARLVHLLHTMAPLHWFDLVLTLPQYRLPERSNVVRLAAPLNRAPSDRLQEATARIGPRLRSLPRPHIALLVGGSSSSYELDAATAARLGREASAAANAAGGSLWISTSPRTPPVAAEALLKEIACPSYAYRWRAGDPDNPYLAFLALADRFLVTVDSASLVVEACTTGRPVEIWEWPARFVLNGPKSPGDPPATRLARLRESLVYLGLVKPRRDFAAFQRVLRARGLVTSFGEGASVARQPLDDLERAVERVRALLAHPRRPAEAS